MTNWTDWLLMLSAVAYLVIAITETDGPANLFAWFRERPLVGKLFECPICASIWLALLVLGLMPQIPFLVYGLALAGQFVVIGRIWEKARLGRKQALERERIDNAEELLSSMMALSDEGRARAVIAHYLGGLDLSTAVFLGMRDEKQESFEPS